MPRKLCFVICPIGSPGSEIRNHSDLMETYILKQAFKDTEWKIVRADEQIITGGQGIMKEIYQDILNADIVVADLTIHKEQCEGCIDKDKYVEKPNPNVFYEVGLRQALKGKTILIYDESFSETPKELFDFQNQPLHPYQLQNAESLKIIIDTIKRCIKRYSTIRINPILRPPDEYIAECGPTVLIDYESDVEAQYKIAMSILNKKKLKSIFLMQTSSSIILGHEDGGHKEEKLYKLIIRKINKGVHFYHVVNLIGIDNHLRRNDSKFSQIPDALRELHPFNLEPFDRTENVEIHGHKIKKVPKVEVIKAKPEEVKLDKQARVLVTKYKDDTHECVLVVDLGANQNSFHFKGDKVNKFYENCKKFYTEVCEVLKAGEVIDTINKHKQYRKAISPWLPETKII